MGRKLIAQYNINSRMSGMVSGKNLHHQACNVWRHWQFMIPDMRWDIGHFFNLLMYNVLSTWVCMHLDGCTCWECLPDGTCDSELPEHEPRTSARAQACVRGSGGLPACHRPGARRKTRGRKRKIVKGPGPKNTHVYIYIYPTFF